jgi:hypothetical protein
LLVPIGNESIESFENQFAKKYGFHLRFYAKGMGAIFDKWPQQQVASKAAKADGSNNMVASCLLPFLLRTSAAQKITGLYSGQVSEAAVPPRTIVENLN